MGLTLEAMMKPLYPLAYQAMAPVRPRVTPMLSQPLAKTKLE